MPTRRVDAPHRARATLVATLVLLAATAAGLVTPARGQESPAPASPTSSPDSSTTSAPPSTVDLGDGDIVLLPPGAGDPSGPDDPDAEDPGQQGNLNDPTQPHDPNAGDPDAPSDELPDELAVVVLPDPTPGLNQALAAIDVSKAQTALDAANAVYQPSLAAERDAFAARRRAIDNRRAAGDRVRAVRSVVDELAINALMYGSFGDIEIFAEDASLDDVRDATLVDVAAEKVFGDLATARGAYAVAVAGEQEATRTLQAVRRQTRGAESIYLDARAEMDQAIIAAEASRREVGPAILGVAVLDAVDLVTWYRTYYAADPPVAPIQDIIDAYLAVGEQEGVTGDIAFAQAMLETGGFRSGHARDFNFAGIGAYDSCSPRCGFNFPSIEAGVRSHIQLLRAYATPGLTRAELATEPDPRLSPERVRVAGCCARWTQLTGIWATDPNYDRKVLGIYRLMVEVARTIDRARV